MTHDPDGDKQSCAARRYGGTDQRQRPLYGLSCTTGQDFAAWCAGELRKPEPYQPPRMVWFDTGDPATEREWLELRNL